MVQKKLTKEHIGKIGKTGRYKYPFLDATETFLKQEGFSLDDIGNGDMFGDHREKAHRRVKHAIEGTIYKEFGDADKETYTFFISLLYLKILKNDILNKKFALMEAKRSEEFLKESLKDNTDPHIIDIFYNYLFDTKITKTSNNDKYTVSIADYLKHSVYIRDKAWKLINQTEVVNGFVALRTDKVGRLIRQTVANHIDERITKANIETPEGFIPHLDKLRDMIKGFMQYTVINEDDGIYPPCILHAVEELKKGNNLSNSGRFMLATYFASRGWTVEQIGSLFLNAPDYNEKITLYHISRVMPDGSHGDKPRYSCASCNNLNTSNLCFRSKECGDIIHPLQFKKMKK